MRLLTAKALIALSSALAAATLSAGTVLGASIDKTPAKELFGKVTTPAPLAARSIGFYAKGCLAGATKLAVNGPGWQAMRLSRNRLWGHPRLIALIERLSRDAREYDGWTALMVGDMPQPHDGPILTGD